jgi:dTDP-4-dehydrorhamnose 3,5-epimerase
MAEIVESSLIKGVFHAHLKAHGDPRGRFMETYRREWFPGGKEMVQGNRSDSIGGVLRGMHYHFKQADYWYVLRGQVFVALFDARKGGPTYGASETFVMGEVDNPHERDRGVYIPPGVAHGFLTLTDCTLTYLVESTYDAKDELGIIWNDPAMKIAWPTSTPTLSDRDQRNPLLKDIRPEHTPYWRG